MRFSPSLEQGRLLRRYKRFLADVELASGEQLTIHCPNTGSMLNCMREGGLVWFSREPLRDPLEYQVVEAQPDVLAAVHSVRFAKVVRRSIHLTPFGEDFCRTCLLEEAVAHAPFPERLWGQHLTRPFPPDLRGADVGGVEVVLLDSDIAGYVTTWLSSGPLNTEAHRILGQRMDEAYRVARLLVDSTDAAYFEGLGNLAHAILGADEVRDEFTPPRSYLACKWSHSAIDEPMVILSELDAARYEVRKVHQFADGRLERADRITDASTSLSWEPTPSEAEIATSDEFEPSVIGAETFEDYWRRAVPVGLPVLIIDGDKFDDYAGFVARFSALLEDFEWNGTLDAFNDILRGGCGTPDGGFEFRWLNSSRSRQALGWPATIRWFEDTIARAHSSNIPRLTVELEAARRGQGTTLFEWIVEIVETHGPGGREAEDSVLLRLF